MYALDQSRLKEAWTAWRISRVIYGDRGYKDIPGFMEACVKRHAGQPQLPIPARHLNQRYAKSRTSIEHAFASIGSVFGLKTARTVGIFATEPDIVATELMSLISTLPLRSPWDQNEIMLCPTSVSTALQSALVLNSNAVPLHL